MKRVIAFILVCILGYILYLNREIIIIYITDKIFKQEEIVIPANNQYTLNNNYEYIQITNNFYPTSKQDIKNIIYTFLDHGWDEFTFYCDKEYENCIEDIKTIAQNSDLLSDINNFVHPYNSYNKLYITVNNFGEIKIKKENLYTKEEINTLNQKIDTIIKELNLENKTKEEQLKLIHDYIIDNSVYDSKRAELIKEGITDDIKYPSHKAIGPLINGLALCSGYSDALSIFLNKLNIKNYKVASPKHVWNAMNINNKWYHTDLTWDDPVTSTNENVKLEEFFLIDTTTLEKKDLEQHTFDKNVYIELKN